VNGAAAQFDKLAFKPEDMILTAKDSFPFHLAGCELIDSIVERHRAAMDRPATCKTCAHWKRAGFIGNTQSGHCRHALVGAQIQETGDCPFDGLGALAQGGEAWIATGQDFGCVHHTEKEQND
jgi:hypothetical protein